MTRINPARRHTPGTGATVRPNPLAWRRAKSNFVTREIPATTSQGIYLVTGTFMQESAKAQATFA